MKKEEEEEEEEVNKIFYSSRRLALTMNTQYNE